MILVLGGTLEGREIAAMLQANGFQVILSVVTDYGADLAHDENDTLEVIRGAMSVQDLTQLVRSRDIDLLIDATHPYAREIKRNLRFLTETLKITILRYLRSETKVPENPLVHLASSPEEAAEMSFSMADCVFSTIGTRQLQPFIEKSKATDKRLVVRILPDPASVRECILAGVLPRNIVAMQGPFPSELNIAMFKHFNAGVIVCKESGDTGGTMEKLEAAFKIDIPAVIISRPDEHTDIKDTGNLFRNFDALLIKVKSLVKIEGNNNE